MKAKREEKSFLLLPSFPKVTLALKTQVRSIWGTTRKKATHDWPHTTLFIGLLNNSPRHYYYCLLLLRVFFVRHNAISSCANSQKYTHFHCSILKYAFRRKWDTLMASPFAIFTRIRTPYTCSKHDLLYKIQ